MLRISFSETPNVEAASVTEMGELSIRNGTMESILATTSVA
jgi:hypothetical protein